MGGYLIRDAYWVKAVLGYPYYAKDGVVGPPAHGRHLYLRRHSDAMAVCAVLNSSLFYLYFIAFGDCFHLNHSLACAFPFPSSLGDERRLGQLGKRLVADLKKNAERMTIRTRDGHQISYDEFYASGSKPIIDDIDAVLAEHFGFSAEELDMIVNFDAKFRLGSEEAHDG